MQEKEPRRRTRREVEAYPLQQVVGNSRVDYGGSTFEIQREKGLKYKRARSNTLKVNITCKTKKKEF